MVARLQGCGVAGLRGYKVARLQGCKVVVKLGTVARKTFVFAAFHGASTFVKNHKTSFK